MATLEEIIRKRKETEGKGNTTTLERILVERNLRTHGNNSKAIKGYNDWIGRVNASRDKYIEDAKSRADVYQPSNLFNSYADTTDAEIRALAQEGQKYREHFQKYGDLYGADMANKIRSGVDDVDSYLHDLSVGLGAERRYWEGFTDLEDFNTKRAAAEAAKKEAEEYAANKEKYKAYDFAAGEEKATYLKGIAERLADIASKERGDGNTLVGGGLPTFRERRETADREREVVYQELRSRYPELADYDLTELNNYIAQLGDEIEGGKSFLELDKFSNYGNPRSEYYDPNFEQYAKYDPSRLDRISYLNDGFNESYDPYAIAYHYINSSEDVKHDIMNRYANANGGDTNSNVIQMRDWLVDLNNMSEEQKKNFNYLYSYTPRYAIPKGGEKRRVERYTEYILPEIENIAEYKFGKAHPFLASLLSMAYTPLSGVEVVADTAKYLGNVLIDPNNAKMDSNSFAEDKGILMQGVSDTVDWNIGSWDAFDFIYNTGMSGVDSAVASFIPGGYMLLGLSAAANGVNDGLERGMSDGQALANGVFSGIFEALFEKISIGNLDSMKSLKPKTLKQFGKEMVKSMGVNASEEALTELANITYDIIANGELSQLQQLVGSGKSYIEAIGELGLQVLESGASGALMGMGFSGAASGVNAAVNTFKQNKIGKGIVADGKAQDYISRGLELPDTKAFKYAEAAKAKLDKGKSANVRIGKLAQNLSDSQMISSFRSQLGEKSGDIAETLTDLVKGREVSNKAIRSILQNETALSMLNESFGTSFTADSKVEDVNEGIKKGFETPKTERDKIVDTLKKNVDSKGVNAYADTIEALQRGEVVSDKEINAFLKNPQALAALNEITGEAFTKKSTTNTVRKAMVKDNMSRAGRAIEFGTTLDIGANGLKGLVSVANHSSGSMANIAQAYNAIYQAAKQGKAITDAKNPYLAELNAAQKLIAYEYGVMDSLEKKAEAEKVSPEFLDEAKVKAAQSKVDEAKTTEGAKKKGSVVYSGDRGKLSDLQKKSLEVLEKISTSLGVTFHMYESKKVNGRFVYEKPDGVRTSANGWYDTKTGEIWLDINAGLNGDGTIIFTAAHELTHFIKQWSPAKFKIFADFLVEQYNERGFSVDSLVQDQIDKAKRNGREISRDEAYEEVIADSCETFLRDSNAAEKIAALNEKDAGLAQKIKQFISNLLKRLRELMSGMKPDSFEGNLVSEMTASIEQLHKLWTDALADAGEAYSTIGSRNLNDFVDAKNTNGESLFQYRAMEADEDTYREMLKKWGKMTDSQISNLFLTIDNAMELIKDNLEALDYAWEADIDDRAFSPVKPNSDKLYQVSLDFSTLCRKRLLQQMVQTQLQEALNEPLTREEGIAIRDALIAIQEEGRQIEVACALCYVESARMKSPEQIRKFMDNKEKVIKEFFAGKSGGSMKEKLKKAETDAREKLHKENPNGIKGKDGSTMLDPRTASLKSLPKKYADEIRSAKKAAKASYAPTTEEQRLIEVAKGMTVSDFTSPEGLENLAKNYRDLFDAYTSFVRNATKSKGIEGDTWWRAGDSMQIGDVLIANMNKENGLRSQSWSDFQVVHILDYIAATIELATRNTKEQAYTKVPDFAELMGQTGVMINLSLIPTAKFNGKLEYDSVEGIDYKRALELRDKYHATVGTICIGIDNVQIQMLLGDVTVDYVIPYHKSGMSAVIRKAMHIPTWTQYEEYQSEKNLSRAEAKKQTDKHGVKLLAENDPNYQKHPNFSDWFDIKEAQQIAKMENANPSDKAKQKKYGVMYGGYMAMQNAANNYLKLCAERGISPKFSHENADFTTEENYWKLLIDRKMVDNVTGEVIEQQTIKPIFDEAEVMRILNDELERYPKVKADQEYAIRRVTEAYLSGRLKGGMSSEAIAKIMQTPVDNVTTTNIVASGRQNLLSEGKTDDSVNKGTEKNSLRDPDALTNREILANMLDSVAESDRDKAFLDKYKARLAQIDDDTAEIARLKEEKKGAEKLRREVIASKIEKLENGITESEKWLKNLEETATLKRLVNKEREAMYAEAVLAGQMAQGRIDAAKLRRSAEKLADQKSRSAERLAEQKRQARQDVEDAHLAGQMAQGKADAKVIRKQQEKLDKEKQKRADMRSDMQQRAKESKAEAVAREKQKRADMLAEYRARVAEREQRIKEKYQEARERSIEGRNKTKIRKQIKGVVSTLHNLLNSDSKEKHVPSGLRTVVADALSMINMDTVDAEKRIKIYNERIAKADDPVVKEALTHKRDEIEAKGVRFAEKIAKLQDAYAQIKKDASADVRSIYSEDIEEYIKTVREQVGDTSIKDMDIDQLEAVYEMFKIILKNVRDGNKLRLEDIKKTIAENSMAVSLELAEDGKNNKALTKVGKMLKKFGWSLLKPGTAMKVIGSKTLAKLYENIRKGEGTWAVDIKEAVDFFEKIRNKYKFDSWNLEKKHDFTDDVGNKFSLTVEQIMSLYAYSKRDKADLHLEKGGFVFDSNITVKEKNKLGIPVEYYVNDTNPYRLNKAKVAEISSTLTKEQIDFVDEMQAYLSDVMGKKGNEVSMKMYDVRLFKEKYYFPLKTSKYFREFNPEKGSTPKIKNSGFTHKTLPGASNPIVLSNFMDVWTGHINDMAMYHAFTLPVEDFMKVYNYNSREDGFSAIKQKISEHYGDEANNYIQTLIDQLNGGARSDPDADMLSRGIAKFKKAKTFVSASVVIQQMSALARAWAYIDPKYFVDKPQATSHDKTWAEIKKYAPVAIIKEMGRFDANMGRSTADYIMKRSYKTIKEKAKGIFTDKEYRDDVLSKAPALADELAWCAIWKAVKREVAATTDLEVNSAEYFERCGERFTEIIENTQVYDSVLSKSEIMRSKDSGLKMVTAFASEPLTTVNMMVDAIVEGNRGRRSFARRSLGSVMSSVVLNSILVSIVYAARDDDEDETYSEKYLASLTSELIDGFNPLTYIPFVRDVWSAMQGYDIERTDMSMFGDLWKSVEGLFSTSKGGFDKVSDFVGNVAALFGIPADNIMRDARAIYNVGDLIYNKFANDLSTTKWGVRDAVAESVKNVVPLWNKIETFTGNKRTKYDEIYEALVSGDETYIKRAKSHFKPEELESGIKRGLRDNDIRVKEAAEAYLAGNVRRFGEIIDTIAAEGVFEAELIESTVRSEINRLKPDEEKEETVEVATSIYKSSDINVAFDSGDNEQALEVLAELIEVKTINNVEKLRKEAEKKGKTISEIELLANAEFDALSSIRSSITSYWKPRYILASEDGNSEEMDRIYNILLSTDLYGKWNKLEKTLRNWLEE